MASADLPLPRSEPFKKSVAREYLESVVVAIILALFIRTFVVQAFKIPTGSMEQNLLIGDHLLVNKMVYSPSLGGFEDKLLPKKPIARGHVVVFKYPDDPTRDFIKRVIGLPGETVELRNKIVYVDGQPLDEPYVHFLEAPLSPSDPEYGYRGDERFNWGPQTVPAGQLFVLGDNRDNSRDSRFFGFVPQEDLLARATVVYWSYEASRGEYAHDASEWIKDTLMAFARTRWDRIGHGLE
jgi:signal peptidase I